MYIATQFLRSDISTNYVVFCFLRRPNQLIMLLGLKKKKKVFLKLFLFLFGSEKDRFLFVCLFFSPHRSVYRSLIYKSIKAHLLKGGRKYGAEALIGWIVSLQQPQSLFQKPGMGKLPSQITVHFILKQCLRLKIIIS